MTHINSQQAAQMEMMKQFKQMTAGMDQAALLQ
jgi:hypothetical protein